MSTARDIIEGGMRLIGVLATGETASAEEAADGLSSLNDMLDSWSIEGLIVHAVTREEFTLTPSTGAYTMGSGGTLNTTRPFRIERACLEVQDADPYEIPMTELTVDQWAEVALKSLQSDIPTSIYVEGTFPLMTINLWPVPSAAEKLVLYSLKPLTQFAGLTTAVSLPPGYAKALKYGLALELAPEYGRDPSALVIEGAAEAKGNIKRANMKPRLMGCDSALAQRKGSGFDYRTGE